MEIVAARRVWVGESSFQFSMADVDMLERGLPKQRRWPRSVRSYSTQSGTGGELEWKEERRVELTLLSVKHTFSVRAGLPQLPLRQPLLSVVKPRPG